MTMLTAVLSVLLLVSLFANYRMYRKVEAYEEWYVSLTRLVSHVRFELHRIDQSGAFRSDDEVGYFFDALKDMMGRLFKMGFAAAPPEDPARPTSPSAISISADNTDARGTSPS